MRKIFTVLVISIFVANTCFALSLELSDVIKEAREAEKIKLSQNQTQEKSIKQVNSAYKDTLCKGQTDTSNKTK